jgi:hypothetical protein
MCNNIDESNPLGQVAIAQITAQWNKYRKITYASTISKRDLVTKTNLHLLVNSDVPVSIVRFGVDLNRILGECAFG